MLDSKIRCTHKDLFVNEKHRCFGYNMGVCEALKEPCKNKSGRCKFFKPKETYIQELKQCALKLDMDFDDYLEATGLKSVIAYFEK